MYFKTTAVEFAIMIEMTQIESDVRLAERADYDTENEIDEFGSLCSYLRNRKKRDKTYKKILVAEAVIIKIKDQISKEKNEDILKVLRSKLIEFNDKLEFLRIKNKELLDKFFGNSRR